MHLIDRPYETHPEPLRADQRAELRFDARLLAATASAASLTARGFDLSKQARADDPSIWDGSTTPAAFCKLLRDYEAACGVAFEHVRPDATDEEQDLKRVIGPVSRLLATVPDDPPAWSAARSAYLRGDWQAALELTDGLRIEAPRHAMAHLLRAHALLRLGQDALAEEAVALALPLVQDLRDLHLHASYLSAFLATRGGTPRRAALIGSAVLGALGGGRGSVTWSIAADDQALDLAYLAIKACGRLLQAGETAPPPTPYDRVRALIVRHPAVALRLAADPDMALLRDDILAAVQVQHEALQRDIRMSLERWRRELARDELQADDEELVRFRAESALADRRARVSLFDAVDARARLREALPDVLSSTQRSFSSEADDAERSSSAMIPLTQPFDPERRDNKLRHDIERLRTTVSTPVAAPTPPVLATASAARWVLASVAAFATAPLVWSLHVLGPPWEARVIVAACIGGALALGRAWDAAGKRAA